MSTANESANQQPAPRCSCLNEKRAALKAKGFNFAHGCTSLVISRDTLDLSEVWGMPLMRDDGKHLKRTDPDMIQISHCPFCGKSMKGGV